MSLTKQEQEAAKLLAQGLSGQQVAITLGITEARLNKWRLNPLFAEEILSNRSLLYLEGFNLASVYFKRAIEKLGAIIDNPESSCKDVIAASVAIVNLNNSVSRDDIRNKFDMVTSETLEENSYILKLLENEK